MTKLVLSSSNIMGGGPSVIRRTAAQKSNIEFTSSLRSNFTAAQEAAAHHLHHHHHHHNHPNGTNGQTNGVSKDVKPARPPYTSWTTQKDSTLFIPSLDFTHSGLSEDRAAYEITVKLFFLTNKPASCRCAQTREAIDMVLKELHVPSIDLLIVSYPGITFDAEDLDGEEDMDGEDEIELDTDAHAEDIDTMIKTWDCLEQLHDERVISRLGLSEFGAERLAKFLKKTRIRPSVDQINVKDCCVVPKPLILYAKQENIQLLTHNDCSNILPRGAVSDLLGHGEFGAGVLAADDSAEGLHGAVEPQWVIKYTAVVKDRGVVENKGYFAVAETEP